MNERLTYFCDRTTGHCELYTALGADEAAASLYQVSCRSALGDSWLDSTGRVGDLGALRQGVAAAGGGLVARTSQTGTETHLHVESVPGTDYQPSSELLLLSPGLEPAPVPFAGRDIRLPAGAFVLLPATRGDQATLLTFLGHLHRLPGDYRGLVLNVLRRPGIEATIGRLEQRLDRLDRQLTPALVGTGEATTPAALIGGFWPWLLAGLLVLNLLGVVAAALWIKALAGQPGPPPVYQFEVPLDPPSSPGPLPKPDLPIPGHAPTSAHPLKAGDGLSAGGPSPSASPDAPRD
ncbi:MAG TPA: hypothetical protein VES73_11755 [Lamprocystis sp. (in: g-proteobacteria)]|nr:hypothetical protein [Lamprocystis sp. (in: g-proteobacteria)]